MKIAFFMRRISKCGINTLIVIFSMICSHVTLNAQTADPGGPGSSSGSSIPETDGVNSPSVPFDSTLNVIFLAVGVVYAARKNKLVVSC